MSGEKEQIIERAEALWEARLAQAVGAGSATSKIDPDQAVSRLEARMENPPSAAAQVTTQPGRTTSPRPSPFAKRVSVWAATAVAIAGVVFLGQSYLRNSVQPEGSLKAALNSYTTRPGERGTLTVVGAQVFLAPSSTLSVDGGVFKLSGHAIFTVKHKAERPIAVLANGVTIRVLGTTFSVRSYAGDGRTRIAVKEGKVSVQPGTLTSNGSIVLGALDEISVTPGGQTQRNTSRLDDFSLMRGSLVLREANVGDALVEMARWYGRDFRASDSALLARQITITLPQNLTPATLNDIADVLGARVNHTSSVITLEPR